MDEPREEPSGWRPDEAIHSIFRSLSQLVVIPTATTSSIRHLYSDDHGPPSTLTRLSRPQTHDAKSLLLTLHVLFPHELLPALDLLDRKLVTKLTPTHNQYSATTRGPELYYVQSASAVTESAGRSRISNSRYRNAFKAVNTHYEVHLDSWNCSCPAFAYNASLLLAKLTDLEERSSAKLDAVGLRLHHTDEEWRFGGLLTKEASPVPTCKHILAVAMVNAAPALFGDAVKLRAVGQDEMAGWGAGWGDYG